MYHRGAYSILRDLEPTERARVALICHNRKAKELFDFHPKRAQIDLLNLEWWHSEAEEQTARQKYNLPSWDMNAGLPEKDGNVRFYESARDREIISCVLQEVGSDAFVVLAASAGQIHKTFPGHILVDLVERINAAGVWVIAVGRNYDLMGHREIRFVGLKEECKRFVDLVDRLSVPGVASLLQESDGLVGCHSALNVLASHMGKPQLLLYPDSIYHVHIAPKSPWAFGIGERGTFHATFGRYDPKLTEEFVLFLNNGES
jgi:ADP-heptose:LPS heptosyltransferase